MKFLNKGLFLIVVMSWLYSSCEKDDTFEYFVDEPLKVYFDRFEDEAALRGIIIDLVALQISGDIRLITSSQVIGQCAHSDNEPNTVIVDKFYWDAADELEREFLIFHELGHCALNREHVDQADINGFCISMMTSGTGLCQINYTTATREALLDELFTP